MTTEANSESRTTIDRVRQIVEGVITNTKLFIVDIEIRGQKGSRVVDIYLDSEEPLGVGDLARVSREVGFLLETEDVIAGRYNLNVSSPGADRPLRHPRQYRKHIGRTLSVEWRKEGADEIDVVLGDLLDVEGETIVLSDGPSQAVRIPYHQIEAARVQLPW